MSAVGVEVSVCVWVNGERTQHTYRTVSAFSRYTYSISRILLRYTVISLIAIRAYIWLMGTGTFIIFAEHAAIYAGVRPGVRGAATAGGVGGKAFDRRARLFAAVRP